MKLFILLLLMATTSAFSQNKVGFQSITRFDNNRPAVEEQSNKSNGRIIQINIWYPTASITENMSFRDYVGLAGLELDSSQANNWYEAGVSRYFAWPESVKADKKSFKAFLDKKIPMNASRNAPLPQQKYPLVMLVHGYAADYAYLAETLAGSGFVVMQVPVKGTSKTELDYQENGLSTQVLDYEYGLSVLQAEFPVVTNDIGVVGFSFGGQSAVAIALRNKNIKAIVSLDGGIGSAFGAQLLQSQPYYDTSKLNQPILHLYNPRDPYTDVSWLQKAPKSSRWLVAVKNMEHGHFTSFGKISKWLPGIMGAAAPDPGRGYECVIAMTKKFFTETISLKKRHLDNLIPEMLKQHPWMTDTIEKHQFTA